MLDTTDPNYLIVETARRFAQERLAPTAAAREQAGAIEPEIIKSLGEMGFLGATNSADWGGAEIPYETYAQVVEEIAAGDGSVSTLVSVHNAPTCEILEKFGTAEQKERWLRPMASGQAVASFALTEPAAGSDASGIRTRATRTNAGYTINGSKQFISNARIGQTTILFAVTNPDAGKKGISAFVVSNDTPGFSVARVEHKLGQKASDSCALAFDDMQVPDDQRIGEEGEGLKIALSTLESGRIGIAAQSIGMARSALDYAIGYAKERKQFGQPDHRAPGGRVPAGGRQDQARRRPRADAARPRASRTPASPRSRPPPWPSCSPPKSPKRSARPPSRPSAATATWPTTPSNASTATSASAKSTREPPTCRRSSCSGCFDPYPSRPLSLRARARVRVVRSPED